MEQSQAYSYTAKMIQLLSDWKILIYHPSALNCNRATEGFQIINLDVQLFSKIKYYLVAIMCRIPHNYLIVLNLDESSKCCLEFK